MDYLNNFNKEEDNPEDDLTIHPKSDIVIPIIKRDKWISMKAKQMHIECMSEPHSQVCFVSSESSPCETIDTCVFNIREIQKRNMMFKKWPDIPYNFVIGGDGNVYEGRGWQKRYIHFGNSTLQDVLQIAYMGHYKDCDPPKEMVDLGMLLIEYGKQRKFISENYNYVECPLTEFYQYHDDPDTYWESDGYKDFLSTMPPPLPPPPDNEPPSQ